ncbi:chromo domain-containing protein, partial [Colletotrichum tofieldiae]
LNEFVKMVVKYVRRRNTARTFSRRVSTRVIPRQPTATKTVSRSEGSKQSKPKILQNTTSKVDNGIRSPKTERVPKSQDYLHTDELIGWEYYSLTKEVDILTRRPSDGSKRLVPERLIQQRCPSQLFAYWKSFSQPREKTVKSNHYHVFDIIDDDPSQGLKIQWVGYSPSDSDTTWESASKIRKMVPELLDDYLTGKQDSEAPSRIRKPVGISN